MKWHKSFYEQIQECKKTDNRFIVDAGEFNQHPIVVCVPFRGFCSSKNCFEKRKQEGKE